MPRLTVTPRIQKDEYKKAKAAANKPGSTPEEKEKFKQTYSIHRQDLAAKRMFKAFRAPIGEATLKDPFMMRAAKNKPVKKSTDTIKQDVVKDYADIIWKKEYNKKKRKHGEQHGLKKADKFIKYTLVESDRDVAKHKAKKEKQKKATFQSGQNMAQRLMKRQLTGK